MTGNSCAQNYEELLQRERDTAQKVFVFEVNLVRENTNQKNSEYGHFLRSGKRCILHRNSIGHSNKHQ